MQRHRGAGSSVGDAIAIGVFTSSSLLGCRFDPGHATVDPAPDGGAAHARSDTAEEDAGGHTTDAAPESVAVVPAAPTFTGLVPFPLAYQGHDGIAAMTVTVDGHVAFVAGRGEGGKPRDSVIAVDRDGTFAWESDSLTDVGEQLLLPEMASGPGGDVYVARTNYHQDDHDGLVTRLSPSGSVRWTQPVAPLSEPWRSVVIESLAVDPAGNAYVVGGSPHSLPHELTDSDEAGFVARFTAGGTLDWTVRLPARSVASHPSGDVYLTTVRPTTDGSGAYETALVKYDSAGTEIWSKKVSPSLLDLPQGHWDSVEAHHISIPADGTRIFVAAELDDTDDDLHQLIRPMVLAEFGRDGALARSVTLTERSARALSFQDLVASPFGSRSFIGQSSLPGDARSLCAVENGRVIWRHAENNPTLSGARYFAVDVEGNLVVASQGAGSAGSGWTLGRLSGLTGSLL